MTASWKPGLHGVNVYRTPEAWAHPASTRASVTATALIAAAPWSSLASHTDFFIRSPHPRLGDARLAHALDPDVGVLAPVGCVGAPGYLPLAGLVVKPLLHLRQEFRIVHVSPPLSDLYAFDIRRYGKSHTGTNLHTYQPFLQLRPTRLWQVSTRTGHLPAIAFPQSGPRERQAGGFSRQRYQTKTNVSG